jgi:hypothetical protein
MKSPNDVKTFLNAHIKDAGMAFHDELSTDENKDYRRGFRAGVLFSFLRMKADLGDMNAAAEQSTD